MTEITKEYHNKLKEKDNKVLRDELILFQNYVIRVGRDIRYPNLVENYFRDNK